MCVASLLGGKSELYVECREKVEIDFGRLALVARWVKYFASISTLIFIQKSTCSLMTRSFEKKMHFDIVCPELVPKCSSAAFAVNVKNL